MSLIIKKYVKCELKLDDHEKKYEWVDSRGYTAIDLDYIALMLFNIPFEDLVECANNVDFDQAQGEGVYLDLYDDEVGITSIYDIPYNTESYLNGCSIYNSDYEFKKNDFKNVINNYKLLFDKNVPSFYLILLPNNKVVLQQNLDDNGLKVPTRWLEFAKFAYIRKEKWYKAVEMTSEDMSSFYSFQFALNPRKLVVEKYGDLDVEDNYPSNVPAEDVKRLIKEWNELKDEDLAAYFVKQDDESISVREKILDLKFIKMALNQSGEYEIVDECGIGVFDFLEEFALHFSVEDFLNQVDKETYFYDTFSEEYESIKITWCKTNNSMSLELGEIPSKYEHIKRDRERYRVWDADFVEMKLDYFRGLVSYWFSLQQKKAPEIYFTQKSDGTIVIRESLT